MMFTGWSYDQLMTLPADYEPILDAAALKALKPKK